MGAHTLQSAEVRWFFDEGDPRVASLKARFGHVKPEGERLDHYLLTGRNDLGIKFRGEEGEPVRFEVKYLTGTLGVVPFGSSVAGKLERWSKLALDEVPVGQPERASWFAVSKDRRRRRFALDGASAREVRGGDRAEAVCAVELSALSFTRGGLPAKAFTLGFEAIGAASLGMRALEAATKAFVQERPGLSLSPVASASYPEWLLRVGSPRWTHQLVSHEPYYCEGPAQSRPPEGTLPAGTKCTIAQSAGSYARVIAETGVTAYVAVGALVELGR
ncbi:MAG TPA: hypothetical protein VFS43_45635 [Polyangiaceae bacterium]|nr:hypothetical protein [Polyangiaceae bacterium]